MQIYNFSEFDYFKIFSDEFLPCEDSGDDEETIALAETEAKDVRGELDLLEKESKMSIDDVLDDLPKEYVDVLLSGM